MNIYLCAYPIEFPRSEYGGLIAVIAKSPKQVGKILTAQYGKDEYFNLDIAVKGVKYYPLDPSKEFTPGIVKEFWT